MSWKSDKSIERIVKLFKRVPKNVFPEDIEAIKYVNETITESEKQYMVDNLLFAKLLCYTINQNLHFHGNIKMAIKDVSDVFKQPIETHLSIMTSNLNNQDLINYLKQIGVDFDSHKNESAIIKENEKGLIEKLKSSWKTESVTKSFCNTVNEFLKDTDNYI